MKKIKPIFYIIMSIMVTVVLFLETKGYMLGDSGIYFTFCKNFFNKPYSYSKSIVSYGGSSPLFLFLLSIIYQIFPHNWFFAMKFFSITLLVLCIMIVNISIKGNIITYLGMVAGLFFCYDGIIVTASVFETGLLIMCVALLWYFLFNHKIICSIYLLGIFYLIRPELALVAAGMDIYILISEENKKRNFKHMIFSAIPLLIYTVYMTIQTESVLPSSITGRIVYAYDLKFTILEKWCDCILMFLFAYGRLFIWLFVLAIFMIGSIKKIKIEWKNIWYVMITIVLIFLPHIVVPSIYHFIRYTIGIVAFFMLIIAIEIKIILENGSFFGKGKSRHIINTMMMTCLCMGTLIYGACNFDKNYSMKNYQQEKFEILFGKDLKDELENIGVVDGTILMYEIQQQLYLEDFRAISLDAIVGSEMLDYLNKKQTLAEVIKKENIDYVVCHQSAVTLETYKNTEIQELYRKGMELEIGESVIIDGICYKKILYNDANTKEYNIAGVPYIPEDKLFVYGESEPWENGILFWQTVFKVEY